MTNTTLKDRLINFINYSDNNDETLILSLYNYLKDEIRTKKSLIDYGIGELESSIDYIIDEIENGNITNLYDLLDAIFDEAHMNGTLTFLTLQAELEVNSNYTVDEIQGIQAEWNNRLNYEQLHIVLCRHEFYSYMEDKIEEVKSLYQGLTKKELLIKTCQLVANDEI